MKDLGKLQGQSASQVLKQMEADKKNNSKSTALTGAARRRELKAMAKGAGGKAGHRVLASATAYKSDKGRGDVLKAGKHEPYAYYQLNPEMLNPRKRKQAVQTFEDVVSHGKKADKRSGKKQSMASGALAGLSIKK